tara:strand:- start:268 stop:567 length:300 start_codon:yes stop_codon:yes gene_type:complete
MRHKFQNRTENTLEKDDRVYFHFNQFDREVSIAFHSRSDVTEYSMPLDKFITSLQTSIEDFDKSELEVMKTTAAILFTKIRQIEAAKEEKDSNKVPETV